ncbi:GNVR domain-containing protein [Rhizobium sp. IBUN]|uniref:GNVR domain-containing protein n=1 Tax=Rhizobium sp. IBUN TaxID=1042326 RepID=UPI00042221DD|nr:GNVR domain-containing protein [Rhizobium sp. IBUN]
MLSAFKDAVRVRREGLTYLISVGVTSDDADKGARFANLVTTVYIRKQVEAKVANTVSAGKILENAISTFSSHPIVISRQPVLSRNYGLRMRSLARRHPMRTRGYGRGLSAEVLTQFYALQQSAQVARVQYQNHLTRLQDFEAQASLQVADSRVVSAALAQIEPSYPRKGLVLGIMAIVAFSAGVGGALLREFSIGGFTSEDQVSAVLNVPLASVTPDQAGSEVEKPHGRGLSDTIISAPLSV